MARQKRTKKKKEQTTKRKRGRRTDTSRRGLTHYPQKWSKWIL